MDKRDIGRKAYISNNLYKNIDKLNSAMVIFDNETKQFSVVEDREYSRDGIIASAVKKGIASAAGKAAGGLVSDASKGLGDKLSGRDKKRTLLGRLSGRNKALDRAEERAHEEKMARINAGQDMRSLALERLKRYDEEAPYRRARKDKAMDYKHQERMAKIKSGK